MAMMMCSDVGEHKEEWDKEMLSVAAALTTEKLAPLSLEQLRHQQEVDIILARVRSWLEAGQQPVLTEVSAQSQELKSYLHNEVLYQQWQAPEWK